MIRLACCGLMLCAATFISSYANADDNYGDGVHAYFNGRADDALRLLNAAIDNGSRDPRAYYFRGLVQMELGNQDAGKADFKSGADLEASSTGRFFPVNESLQRVQGVERLAIESARASAEQIAAEAGMNPTIDANGNQVQPPLLPLPAENSGSGNRNYPDVSDKVDATTPFELNAPIIMEVRKPDPAPVVNTPPSQTGSPFEKPAETTPPANKNPFDVEGNDGNKPKNPFEKGDG